MKKYSNLFFVSMLVLASACKQDMINLEQPTVTTETPTGSKGSADFTKYVAVGNSLTSGYQAGALFTEGQNNSFPLILSKQFQIVGGPATFNQPDINSVNGYYTTGPGGIALGRLVLFASDGVQADAVPTPSGYPGVPSPYNTADFPAPYTGDKTKLNNFGVPGILLGQVLTPATGGPASGTNPAYNPYYARFASNPSADGSTGSTIIGDAVAAAPTFFTFDLGNNDVLGYATTGGDGSIKITPQANFAGYYQAAINALLSSPGNPKGAVSTIPDVTTIPFFFTVGYNVIELDANTALALTTQLANNYNAFLHGMVLNGIISKTDSAYRRLTYAEGNNGILIKDTDIKNLSPYMAGAAAGLKPYAQARQAKASDLITLSAGSILGTTGSFGTLGVNEPVSDHYVLVPSEIDSLQTATNGYNATIKSIAAASGGRIAVADVNAVFKSLVMNQGYYGDGVLLTPSFAPPFGAFSEDGVHPNSRGYAFLANVFIQAINAAFGATIPTASLAGYAGTRLPLLP